MSTNGPNVLDNHPFNAKAVVTKEADSRPSAVGPVFTGKDKIDYQVHALEKGIRRTASKLGTQQFHIPVQQDIAKMIEEARAYRRRTGKDAPEADESNTPPQDINISEGEVYISPEDVAVIGRDRLTKINNRGRPKTDR